MGSKKTLSVLTGTALAFFSSSVLSAAAIAHTKDVGTIVAANEEGKEGGCSGKEGGCSGDKAKEHHKKHKKHHGHKAKKEEAAPAAGAPASEAPAETK